MTTELNKKMTSLFINQVGRHPQSQQAGKALALLMGLTAAEFDALTISQAQAYKARFLAIGGKPGRRGVDEAFRLQAAWAD